MPPDSVTLGKALNLSDLELHQVSQRAILKFTGLLSELKERMQARCGDARL